MKKVLFLVPDCLFFPSGGLGERIINLIPHFKNKLDCSFFTSGVSGNIHGFRVMGLHQHGLKMGDHFTSMTYSSLVESFVDEVGVPDVIVSIDHATIYQGFSVARHRNTHWMVEFDLALFSFEKQYNKQELTPINLYNSFIIEQTEKFGSENAHQVILCSDFYKEEIPYKNKYKEHEVIANGIDVEKFSIKKPEYKFEGNFEYNLVYLGRLNSQKGVQFLLDCKLPENVALHFAGTEKGSNLYQRVLDTCNNSNNKFYVGEVRGEEKIKYLQSADAVLFPSIHEPFGIVGLEAMASKTLLITSLVDGIKSYTNEDCSIKVEPNTQSIEKSIIEFLNLTQKEKNDKIEKAFKKAQDFGWGKFAEKYISIINNLDKK
jgi:glycosyltransferase involved in cell wall biosynthesis